MVNEMSGTNDDDYSAMEKAPKRKKGLATTKRIIDASAELFAQKGYDAVSLREIADAVGVKESSIYNHFDNKAKILESIFQYFADNASAIRPSDDELAGLMLVLTPEAILKGIIVSFGKTIDKLIGDTARIILVEMHRNQMAENIYLDVFVNEPCSFFEKLFAKMMESEKLRRVDARQLALVYNNAILSLSVEHGLAKGNPELTRAVVMKMMTTVDFFCEMLR